MVSLKDKVFQTLLTKRNYLDNISLNEYCYYGHKIMGTWYLLYGVDNLCNEWYL